MVFVLVWVERGVQCFESGYARSLFVCLFVSNKRMEEKLIEGLKPFGSSRLTEATFCLRVKNHAAHEDFSEEQIVGLCVVLKAKLLESPRK